MVLCREQQGFLEGGTEIGKPKPNTNAALRSTPWSSLPSTASSRIGSCRESSRACQWCGRPSALSGPLVGGAFATAGLWRFAFWSFALQGLVLAVLVHPLLP